MCNTMDSNIMEIIEEFMESALAQWVQLFEKMVEREDGVPLYSQYMEVNSITQSARDRYKRLTNGIFLNEIMRIIDPNPKVERLYDSERDDHMLRVQNFSILNRHIRAFYQEDLQQLILMPLPNVAILGQDPITEAAVEELRRLLLLLLGCAVQCEEKETFIQQIQSLDIETQAAIASCIQQVTQDPRTVLPLRWEELVEVEGADFQLVFTSMAKQIQNLLAHRDTHLERIAELCREREAQSDSPTAPLGGHSEEPSQGLALQLADSKAKLRRLKQQLEDKGDQILDYNLEIQTMEDQLKKLQKENRSLQGEVRGMRALRDELDCARERATRAEQLQTELQSCKHRLRSLELTRTQLKEQQQLCAALQETKVLLEEQLVDARARCSSLRELERDNLLLRQRILDVEAERDTERQRVDELLEMNMSLEADLRHSSSSSGSVPARVAAAHRRFFQSELDSDEELSDLIDQKPLSVEVGEASTLMLLGAEQENAELRRRLEELQAQQEADSPDAKDELACLETTHQKTLREFQNLKNENATLKQRLEQLVTKLQQIEDKRKVEGVKKPDRKEEENVERGVQGSESCRGEGEGRVRMMGVRERRGEIIVTRREAGVGEEILHIVREKEETCDEEVESKWRGEAEGGQKDKEKEIQTNTEQTTVAINAEIQNHPKTVEDNTETTAADQSVCSLSGADVELLTNRLQEAHEEADRQAIVAQELRSKLGEQSKKTWEAEQRLVVLEAELQRLKKAAGSLGDARRQIEVLQSEGLVMEEELCRLRSQAELHRMQSTVIATLEGERAALERDRDTLRSTMDALRTAQRKSDQLELSCQTLRAEVERHGRSLETSRRREEELESELREATVDAESLARARNQALLEASRLEQEKEVCQSELDSQRKEGRQREREAARLRQQLESTTLALEHSNQRARALDAEHRSVCQQLSESKELCTRLQDLEKEFSTRLSSMEEGKQQLQEQYADAQAKINSLSQDLSNKQECSQKLSTEVERLSQKLQKAEAELKTTTSSLNQSQERIESLCQSLKKSESLLQLEKRRGSVEVGTTSNSNSDSSDKADICQTNTQETSHRDQSPAAGKGRDLFLTHDYATGETERQLSERLIELEREKAVAIAGQEALLSRLSQSQEACEHLKEQLEALRRHSLSLQDSCTRLQTLNTQLQVEQASLSSQHAAVLARCSDSEARCAALEAESKVWAREREESVARMEALRRDHDRMTALQQRQEVELEELLDKHSQLRSNNRSLEAQYRELEARYKELLDGKSQLEERELEMKMERKAMEAEAQRRLERERELERLKEDNERLQAQQKEVLASQAELLAQGSGLRAELSSSQLERTRLEGELSGLRETNQSLDLNSARLSSQYQLLTQLKGNMEEENRHLAEQNQSLLKENRALLEQSLERRDQHYSQQREYQEKLSELRREKQKLVEKIMDQYRVLEPSMQPPASKAKKSNWIADRMKKLIKPRGGGREGRALFTAMGSVENLADSTEFTSDTHTPQPDPRSAPVSPCPMRKAPSQTELDISAPGTPAMRSSARRKLGSRHGWGLGLARGGSQSFSPGDHKTPPRLRLRSSQNISAVLWEGQRGETNAPQAADAQLSSQESVAEDEGRDNQHSSDDTTTT
ncbi:LOW QUALITY PROTEIN: coiled-coil domain containing 88A [Anoplopoma fimbria]|uniref:LOW QUALITY PROTEIN: coiled-coil domain containing 88A n=1 Tax=Anoplopoma fimbria TaxID=229290 RepID=UPI0023EB712D|nr:LOW QUALITY PROTEIN: coiled-coil domain containing 88A [Anoplopoma fimbria]